MLCGTRQVDVASIRRSLTEAMLSWPGEERDRWWKWLTETSRGLNYAARVIDAPPHEVIELSRHGVTAVTRVDGDESRLLVLNGTKRSKFRLFDLPGDPTGQSLSQRQLFGLLNEAGSSRNQRWVVLDPVSDDMPVPHSADRHGGGRDEHASPVARLREFLRPEGADLWIVVIFALVIGLLTLATPIAVEALVNTVAFGTLLQPLVVLSLILLTFLMFRGALRFLQKFVVEVIQRRLLARTAARLAWQLPRVRLDHAHGLSPELLNRFFDIVTMQKIVAQLALDGLTVVLTVGLGMIVLAFYHPWLLAFDAVLLMLLLANVFVMGRGALRTSITESRSKYAVAGWLEDISRCPTTFKASGAAEFALMRADRLTTDYLVAREAHYRVLMRQILMGLVLEAFASAVLLGLGGFLVIQGQMTLGQLVAAELIVTLIVAAIAKFDKHLEGFYDLLTSMDKLGHLFDLPVESSSGALHVGRTGAAGLSLRYLSFAHDGGPLLLNDVSFDVTPGEVIAITGPAGCGKSTLIDLLFRLREPSSGRIVLDDLDLTDLRPDVLRQNVSLVRGIEILEGTLAVNVHLDRPDVSTVEVREALRRVGLETVSICDPKANAQSTSQSDWRLDMHLAHNGQPLSKSQARRLMLARALVARPRLLLIDGLLDSLADIDAESILHELKSNREACTVLIATSRQAIAEQCDRTWNLAAFPTSK